MKKCWRFWTGRSSDDPTLEHYGCGYRAYYSPIKDHPRDGAHLVIDGEIQVASTYIYWGPPHANRGIEAVERITSRKGQSSGNCDNCPPPGPGTIYDCINGVCTPREAYNTPGIYATLSDCEVNCGPGCSGKCVSNAEWATVEGLAGQLKNKSCS
jgi:hypothetical protein